ncbi:AzlC family ABC transporter permease [Rhodobacter capsulatus]|uniref:AzlC family ABC transporter permease n=1 Tax=Rhodobacter capsulatus TaxID=1061 RepID=UPI0006DD0819|nr:AzlC family ABC transporter permease [Rhodobacter capsulatus]KQB13378.1 branched-chain amino acid transporter AzlC [Rhodobacter capsulatus]KQB13636.1 branched-chain amino acid transporter AzlC [Rhodobacter capsulatus]PZX24377.1 putative branched-subunit amino acid permease [Rhodobacter capsulatus]QNR63650.1 AzlC family ABC transporter permease [Rhodobacter capsulatus]
MTAPSPLSSAYWRGCRQGLPFVLVILPFGLLFGVAGTEAGLSLAEVMGFSILVIAGASQFTAVQLMTDHASTVMVILASLAVNLRMAMYSASLAPHLGAAPSWARALVAYFMVDQVFALANAEYERAPKQSLAEKLAYYAGACTPVCPLWYVATLAGAWLGKAIPPAFALDFAVPVTFLAMIAPMLRSLPHLVAAAVSIVMALAFSVLPAGTGLILAALCAMAAGAQTELWLIRRRAAQ